MIRCSKPTMSPPECLYKSVEEFYTRLGMYNYPASIARAMIFWKPVTATGRYSLGLSFGGWPRVNWPFLSNKDGINVV